MASREAHILRKNQLSLLTLLGQFDSDVWGQFHFYLFILFQQGPIKLFRMDPKRRL